MQIAYVGFTWHGIRLHDRRRKVAACQAESDKMLSLPQSLHNTNRVTQWNVDMMCLQEHVLTVSCGSPLVSTAPSVILSMQLPSQLYTASLCGLVYALYTSVCNIVLYSSRKVD